VADRPPSRQRTLRLEYPFDRLLGEKLAQAYELLVPEQVRSTARADPHQHGNDQEHLHDETGRHLRPCILRPPEGEPHDRQSIGGVGGVCRSSRIPGPARVRFQDEGYSGATLLRPGLEGLRDLAAAGHIEVALVYSPDRLSRKYAYQVLLAEELSRCGVELVFLKAPSGATPEDQLLVQFQGMIAEYERAQIAERSRRGKRHRAQQGSINVLSGAPYGYRYVKKSDTSAAYYEVIESEAAVVRLVYETYTRQGLSINAIARMLNERQIPTRTETTRWERSTVWGMLRNPAYRGRACFGKTEIRPRQRITRPLRQRHGFTSRNSANHERPRPDWIEIAVPALVSEETFALAQSSWSKTNSILRGARSSRPSCRECWFVSAAAMRCTAARPGPPPASSTTTAASVPMRIVISKERFATTRRFARTSSMRWCGRNSCGFCRSPP
jgi:site-specific DNA recombinase